MQRSNIVWVLVLLAGLPGVRSVLFHQVLAQATVENKTIDRLGDALYTPTKLEWAAIELQANYG